MSPPMISTIESTIPEGVTIDEYRRARPRRRSRSRFGTRLAAGALAAAALTAAAPQAAMAAPDEHRKQARNLFVPHPAPALVDSATPRAAAGAPGGLTFGGASSQEAPVVLRSSRDGRRTSLFLIHHSAPCSDGDQYMVTSIAPRFEVSGGRFSGRDAGTEPMDDGSMDYDERYTGRVRGGTAQGSFRSVVIGRDSAGNELWRCDTGRVAWRAARRAYGGETAQKDPVVIDPRGAKARMTTAWGASCWDDGWFSGPDTIPDLELRRGRLSGERLSRVEMGDYIVLIDRAVRGRVTRRHAAGTLEVSVSVFDAETGAQVDACESGRIRWSARP